MKERISKWITQKSFSQSYNNTLDDYIYACNNPEFNAWDWVFLTAANERQAEAYGLQIDARREGGRLPLNTRFEVVADYKEQRVGSRGAFKCSKGEG